MLKMIGQEITASCMENQFLTNKSKPGGVYWENTLPDGEWTFLKTRGAAAFTAMTVLR